MSDPANSILIEPAEGQRRINERPADGAIVPGDLVVITAANKWAANASAADVDAPRSFALENIADAGGIDDAYVEDDRTRVLYAQSGDLVNAFLIDSEVVVVGTAVESSGTAGGLQAHTTGRIIGYSEEAVTASGKVRLQVRVA